MKNVLLLLLTAIIWGFAFCAQSKGMEHVGPFAFNCLRSLIGALFLIPCYHFLDRLKPSYQLEAERKLSRKVLLVGGICCGIVFSVASCAQQIGIKYTTVGKAGFITATYILIVPLLGLFMGKKCNMYIWLGVGLAVIGLYLLCITEKLTIQKGDLYVLACAFLFSLHILVIDYFSPKCESVRLSCIQFLVAGILCSVPMLAVEGLPSWSSVLAAKYSILYAGILSSGVAYTLQIIAQKDFNPTIASLIMSLESTFAVIGGWLILNQKLTLREFFGCALMFIAIVIAQIPSRPQTKPQPQE